MAVRANQVKTKTFGHGNVIDMTEIFYFGVDITVLEEILDDLEERLAMAHMRHGQKSWQATIIKEDLARGYRLLNAMDRWQTRLASKT